MASRYFARGDRTQAAAEIRAGAAFLRLEAGRHDATNKTGLEDAAKHLDDLAAGVTKGTVKSPKELDDGFVRADLALARHYHQMPEASAWRRTSMRRPATGSRAQPIRWTTGPNGRDTGLRLAARQL